MPSVRPELRDPENWTLIPNRPQAERKAPYFICGLGGSNRNGESMNVISVLASLPPSSIKLFDVMVRMREIGTNEVVSDELQLEPRYIQNHMPALIEASLVRRLKRGHYMINPDAVMPPNARAARALWSGSGKKGTAAPP
jgi:hypothetical protein